MSCTCPGVEGNGCPCEHCHGSGWYPEMIGDSDTDYNEKYCDCPAGSRLRERDNPRSIADIARELAKTEHPYSAECICTLCDEERRFRRRNPP